MRRPGLLSPRWIGALALVACGVTAEPEPVDAQTAEDDPMEAEAVDAVETVEVDAVEAATVGAEAVETPATPGRLEYLVPELAESPYQLSPGPRRFLRRLSVSPGMGWVGSERLYVFRVAYNPNPWLGYEASLGHNPGESVQALFHMLSVIVRPPLAHRVQPYGTVGYGLLLVFPGQAQNADSATENTFSFGGGLEFYLRDDLALRGEIRAITVLGGDRSGSGTVAYGYREATFGLSFYRSLGG